MGNFVYKSLFVVGKKKKWINHQAAKARRNCFIGKVAGNVGDDLTFVQGCAKRKAVGDGGQEEAP
jgi:hypothetical protein